MRRTVTDHCLGINADRADRGSSVYPHSNFSDPFDLAVSDNEDERNFNNIDDIVAAGGDAAAYAEYEDVHDRPGDFVVYEDGADVDPYVSVPSPPTRPRFMNALTSIFCTQGCFFNAKPRRNIQQHF